MKHEWSLCRIISLILSVVPLATGYVAPNAAAPLPFPLLQQRRQQSMTSSSALNAKRRGRGSFKKKESSSASSPQASGGGDDTTVGSTAATTNINWCPIPPNQKLPEQEGAVAFLDTELPTMKDSATNPTGAVAVVKAYNGQVYCFQSSCPSCKIPLTKAKVIPQPQPSSATTTTVVDDDGNGKTSASSPHLVCDFCKATYNLKDGSKVQSTESAGLFGGVIKTVFASQGGSGPLKLYKLGERNRKLVIAVD